MAEWRSKWDREAAECALCASTDSTVADQPQSPLEITSCRSPCPRATSCQSWALQDQLGPAGFADPVEELKHGRMKVNC